VGRKCNNRSLSVWWIKLAEGTSELRVPRGLQIHTGTENVFIGVITIHVKCCQSVSCSPGVSVVLRNEGLVQRGACVRACVRVKTRVELFRRLRKITQKPFQ